MLCCLGKVLKIKENKLGLSRAKLSQARACLEVINLKKIFELSTYHLIVTLSFFGFGSETVIGLANKKNQNTYQVLTSLPFLNTIWCSGLGPT